MIEPIQAGTPFLNDVESAKPEPGAICVWWLGQSGFIVKSPPGRW